MLLDPETLTLAERIDEVLARTGSDTVYHPELRASQIEIVTPVRRTAAAICRDVATARAALIDRAGDIARIAAAGTHPFTTDWGDVSQGERYRAIEDEYTWASRRSLVCGLHVHVGIGGADRSLAVYNALRSFLPEIQAVAANSPFFEGEDTGLCSVRPKLNGSLPRTGIPPAFASWDEFVSLVSWGARGRLFPDASFLWWDLRPHLRYGTLELRAADSQTSVEDVGAITAFVQSLAQWLADRWDRGERLPVDETHRIEENAWRAVRYGVAGQLVDLDTGTREPVRERIARLLVHLEPAARRLDCEVELAGVRALLAGNGADRQRYVHERDGLQGLVEWLVRETERSARPSALQEPVEPRTTTRPPLATA
jgi:carboxylate-amine ligase